MLSGSICVCVFVILCVCVCGWLLKPIHPAINSCRVSVWGSVNECFAADKQNNCNKKFFFICLLLSPPLLPLHWSVFYATRRHWCCACVSLCVYVFQSLLCVLFACFIFKVMSCCVLCVLCPSARLKCVPKTISFIIYGSGNWDWALKSPRPKQRDRHMSNANAHSVCPSVLCTLSTWKLLLCVQWRKKWRVADVSVNLSMLASDKLH